MRHRFCILVLALVLAAGSTAWAGLVVEDFDYTTGDGAALQNRNGGSGWGGAWNLGSPPTGTIVVDIDSNLTYAGYGIAQSGTGLARGSYSQSRHIGRLAGPFTGTTWFSCLVQNPDESGYAAFLPRASQSSVSIVVDGSSFDVVYSGTTYSGLATLTTGTPHLLVGKLVWGATDHVEVWADPTDTSSEAAMGTADFDSSTDAGGDVNLFTDLSNPGIESYNQGLFDALRMSDRPSAFVDALGDPPALPVAEPAGLGLIGLALLGLKKKRA